MELIFSYLQWTYLLHGHTSSLGTFTALVTTFNLEIGITGAILTKLDGDSRGGAALSVKEVCFWNSLDFFIIL